jgi:hypothetical protein
MNSSIHRYADVERYIHELAIALAGLPVSEREDVIAGVREHIDAALAGFDHGEVDVQRVLDSLGDPLVIAADAGAAPVDADQPSESRSGATASETVASGPAPLLERDWVPAAPILLYAGGLLVKLVDPYVTGGYVAGLLGTLAWLTALAVLVASPLWRTSEKTIGASIGIAGVALPVAVTSFRFPSGPEIVADVFRAGPRVLHLPMLVGTLGIVATVIAGAWLWQRGMSRVPGSARIGPTPASQDRAALRATWTPPTTMLLLAAGPLLLILGGSAALPVAALSGLAGLILLAASPLWRTWEVVVGAIILGGAPLLSFILAGNHVVLGLGSAVRLERWTDPIGYGASATTLGYVAPIAIVALTIFCTWVWLWKRGASRVSRAI